MIAARMNFAPYMLAFFAYHPLLVLPIWYTDCKGTRNSLAGLVLLLHPSSSLGCPSCELHLSTKGTPRCPLKTPSGFLFRVLKLRTVSTPRNVPCPTCPLVPPCCIINRSMRVRESTSRTSALCRPALIQ